MRNDMQMKRMAPVRRTAARGMSLIEVLVSVLVLSLGLLGIAAMQSMALRGGQSSLESSQAVMAAGSIAEAMRANSINLASYNTGGMQCAAVTGTTLAINDRNAWLTSMQSGFGANASVCGEIDCDANRNCDITVQWDDSRAGGGSARTMVTRARI